MAEPQIEHLRHDILGPLKAALERIDGHLQRNDLRAAGIDMIEFVQMAEQHAHEILVVANRISGTFPKLS